MRCLLSVLAFSGCLLVAFADSGVLGPQLWLYRSPGQFPRFDVSAGLSGKCREGYNKLSNESQMLMLDAMGKPGAGIIEGNTDWYGSFSECKLQPHTRYCVNMYSVNMAFSPVSHLLKLGVCLPDACSAEDSANFLFSLYQIKPSMATAGLEMVLADLVKNHQLGNGSEAISMCEKTPTYSAGTISVLVLCSVVILLISIGTFVHWYVTMPTVATGAWARLDLTGKSNMDSVINSNSQPGSIIRTPSRTSQAHLFATEKTPLLSTSVADSNNVLPSLRYSDNVLVQFFCCFALQRNISALLRAQHHPGTIPCLHGLRVLSMCWVILGHTYLWPLLIGISNMLDLFKVVRRFTFQIVLNGTFSVDTFFFISGLLVMFLSMRRMDLSNGHLSWGKFYLHRYLRLTPMYMFILLVYVYLVQFWGEGPFWTASFIERPQCKKYWWTNMLYVNNFVPKAVSDTCMGWTWYLANDMQFYVLSPIFILTAYRFRERGLVLISFLSIAACLVVRGVLVDHYNFIIPQKTDDFTNTQQSDTKPSYMDVVYSKPYTRAAPYIVGLALGFVLSQQSAVLSDIPRSTARCLAGFGWCLAAALLLWPVYSLYHVYHDVKTLSLTRSVLYYTFSRFSWALGLAWIVWACQKGYGGYVNSLLGHNLWIPLSRLTFAAYLLHPIALFIFFVGRDVPFYYTDSAMVFTFAGVLFLSYLAAFIVSVIVELPCLQLEKLVFGR